MAKKKVYAVKKGRTTGLFMTWADCQEQVTGFPGAVFKSFEDPNAALAWLMGSANATAAPTKTRTAHRAATSAHQAPTAPAPSDADTDFIIYTDGSCLRNPAGPGGWAMVAKAMADGEVTERSGGSPSTTNNKMELTAAIEALRFAPEGSRVALYTDSQYLKNGITKWIFAWKRRGWKKADGQPVLNQPLWIELDNLYNSHKVTFHWVKGHAGVDLNERCDELAKKEAMKY